MCKCFYCGAELRWVGDTDMECEDGPCVLTVYDCECGVSYDVWQPVEEL